MAAVKNENGFNRLPLRALDKPLKRFPWSLAAGYHRAKATVRMRSRIQLTGRDPFCVNLEISLSIAALCL